jgi:glycerophosphoryl diester phosphodiesterase
MGSMSPISAGASGYRIVFEMMYPVIPGASTHAGIALGKTADDAYRFGVANPTGGYHLLLRPNLGELQLYRHDAGVQPGVQLGTITTAPLVAGQWASIEVDVTATQVILRRTDGAGWTLPINNTDHRGLYFHLHNGSLTSAATIARFRNMSVTQLP